MVKAPGFLSRLFQSRHIFESVKPIFLVSYLLGMTPFYLIKDKHNQYMVKTCYFGYFLTLSVFAMICTIIINEFLDKESIIGHFLRSDITVFADNVVPLCVMGGAVVVYLSTTSGRLEMLNMMTAFDEADLVIKCIGGIQIMYKRVLFLVWILTGTVISVIIGYTLMNYFLLRNAEIYPSLNFYIAFTMLNAVITVVIGLFLCISKVLHRRFQILNLVSVVRVII